MTTTTRRTDFQRSSGRHRAGSGFTLVELMLAATLSVLVLAGVLSSFLMIGRTGFLASSYSELETETRRGLEILGEDVRMAGDIVWNSSQSITLTLPTKTNATILVTYAYDNTAGSPTFHCFYRLVGDAGATGPRRILIHGVATDFAFQRFKLEQVGVADNHATTDLETKQIELNLRVSRAGATTVAANQSALSARYVLRNKRVSN